MILLDTLKEEKLKSKETIVHCCLILFLLESASLCPLENIVFFPGAPLLRKLAIKRWRIKVVEDSVSPVHRSADRVCHYCISDLLIEISFLCPIHVHFNMNIESMDVFSCLYMVDYIC